ncbi:hypothetical protein [Virgisporangium aurantiacum]|nr:hypothetical protein [Virgisporangium aurantiacum]
MGSSNWDYFVPYQHDLNAALLQLQAQVLADGAYYWAPGGRGSASRYPNRPTTMADLFSDELVQQEGTHSILDMDEVVGPDEEPDFAAVAPVTADEARERTGTEILTREHAPHIRTLADKAWYGRYAVLHDTDGKPSEIYFFGYSGG